MATQFRINAANIDFLQKALNTSNKRATKLGVPCATLNVVRYEDVAVEKHGKPTGQFRKVAVVDVTGGVPVLAGWEMVGLLHHITTDEVGKDLTVQHTMPGKVIPVIYKNQANVCEHCQTNRRRNTTFILRNADDRFIQVGSTCLADFLGFNADPMALARLAEDFATLEDRIRDEEDKEVVHFVKGKSEFFGTRMFLGYVAATIRTYGWLSRGKARQAYGYNDRLDATADLAWGLMVRTVKGLMDAPADQYDTARFNKLAAIHITEADVNEANRVADWMSVYFDDQDEATMGDYLSNLRLALYQSAINGKLSGIVASVFAAYNKVQRDADRIEAAKKAMAASPVAPKLAYVGSLGVRAAFQVRVTSIRGLENSTLIRMEDVDGNKLTWFASNPNLVEGQIYDIVATPKAHEEYKGIKSTIVNRVVVQ